MTADADLAAARAGDPAAFERLVAPHRRELLVHCYRMLGSPHDAEDALQDALLGAWRGVRGFEGRSSTRAWLYRICTNACLRLIAKRPRRVLSSDHGPARSDVHDLGEPVTAPIWLEPLPDADQLTDSADPADSADSAGSAAASADPDADPAAAYARRESVELAFVAALQYLPATQRAVLLLRDVLGYSAAETAEALDTSPASVNSAMQRARRTLDERLPARSQQAELAALGPVGQRELLDAFVAAWERADVPALVGLLAEDVRFTMPPLPAWFDGRTDVARFFTERVHATPWRIVPIRANGQLAFAGYSRQPGEREFRLGAVSLLSVRSGRIVWIASFLDPSSYAGFGLPEILPDGR